MQKVLVSLVILFLSALAAFGAAKPTVKRVENYLAVLDLEPMGKVDKDFVPSLTDCIRGEIVKSKKYEVMDRNSIDKVLKEQAFQMTGCTSSECAVEAGQLLGVGKIVVGSVGMVGKTYILSLSLVNVESGKVEQVEDQECKCEVDDLIQVSRRVAGKLMGSGLKSEVVPVSPANNTVVGNAVNVGVGNEVKTKQASVTMSGSKVTGAVVNTAIRRNLVNVGVGNKVEANQASMKAENSQVKGAVVDTVGAYGAVNLTAGNPR